MDDAKHNNAQEAILGPADAYRMLAAGGEEVDVAATCGYVDRHVMLTCAARHAREQGLEWPPEALLEIRARRHDEYYAERMRRGRDCYLLKKGSGLTWAEIGKDDDLSASGACRRAERYARAYGEEWPIG